MIETDKELKELTTKRSQLKTKLTPFITFIDNIYDNLVKQLPTRVFANRIQ